MAFWVKDENGKFIGSKKGSKADAVKRLNKIKDKAAKSVAKILRRADIEVKQTKSEIARELFQKKKKPAWLAVESSKGAISGASTGALIGSGAAVGLSVLNTAAKQYVQTGRIPRPNISKIMQTDIKRLVKSRAFKRKMGKLGHIAAGGAAIGTIVGGTKKALKPYLKEFGDTPETRKTFLKAAVLGVPLAVIGARAGKITAPGVQRVVQKSVLGTSKRAKDIVAKISGRRLSKPVAKRISEPKHGEATALIAAIASLSAANAVKRGVPVLGGALGLGLGTEAIYQKRKFFKKKRTNIP